MSQIELRNVNKTYGKNNCVIDNLNLRIPDGDFTVMVGPSELRKIYYSADDSRVRELKLR